MKTEDAVKKILLGQDVRKVIFEEETVEDIPKWRLQNPKYQEKTLGGVYFWDAPNAIWGRVIDPSLYKKLPDYIKKAVISCDATKTADGVHASIYYVSPTGEVCWADEYGIQDFLYSLRSAGKSEYGDMNDFVKSNNWKVGTILKRN